MSNHPEEIAGQLERPFREEEDFNFTSEKLESLRFQQFHEAVLAEVCVTFSCLCVFVYVSVSSKAHPNNTEPSLLCFAAGSLPVWAIVAGKYDTHMHRGTL